MGKSLEQRLAEIDKRYGLDTEPDDEVKERKRKKTEEVYEAILREGVTAKYDPETGLAYAYVNLDDLEEGETLSERLDAVDARHGVKVG